MEVTIYICTIQYIYWNIFAGAVSFNTTICTVSCLIRVHITVQCYRWTFIIYYSTSGLALFLFLAVTYPPWQSPLEQTFSPYMLTATNCPSCAGCVVKLGLFTATRVTRKIFEFRHGIRVTKDRCVADFSATHSCGLRRVLPVPEFYLVLLTVPGQTKVIQQL
jgi:hypothetical protein